MTEETNVSPDFDDYAIVELMGHVRMTGRLTEVEMFGAKLGKIAVIDKNGETITTQFFGGSSVYRITPCTEETAKAVAGRSTGGMPDVPWDVQAAIRAKFEQELQDRQKQIEGGRTDLDEGEEGGW